jgi:hypothetical protein
LAQHEVEALKQGNELFDSEHYDLAVVEPWRALEARLRQALLSRGITARLEPPQEVLRVATRKGILHEPTLSVIEELTRHWHRALSTEPLSREPAVEALSIVRHVLSVTPVKESVSEHRHLMGVTT